MGKLFSIILFFSVFTNIKAQVGGLAGAVTDAITGRELLGVIATLKPGGKEDVSDVEGRFLFNNLQPGIYSLELREANHKTAIIPLLRVSANEITVVRLIMYDSVKALAGVVITVKKPRAENNAGVAMERKSSTTIMDGISQESIKRTPDRTTAEVLRRISGITILDNKYPVIRGLADRYNMALLNGLPLPSSLPDRKAFAFDAIPAGLLDNIFIIKSAMPDLPSEFAGAIIQVHTKDIPDESVQTISIGFGGYTNSVGQTGSWQTNKAPNALGMGGLGRQLPEGMPNSLSKPELTQGEIAEFSKKFVNDWGLKKSTILPGLQFQYSNSSRFKLLNKEAGSLFALSYSNLTKYNPIARKEYKLNNLSRNFTENQYSNNVLLGAMFNLSVKLNKKNKITFRNFLNNNATEENNLRQGVNVETDTFQRSYAMNYTQNYFMGTQLAGDHFSPKTGLRIKWDLGLQKVYRNTPDYRRLLYVRDASSPSDPMTAAIGTAKSFENGGKMYSDMTENTNFAGFSIVKSMYTDNFKSDIKIGGFHQRKSREFNARILSVIDNTSSTSDSLKRLPIESIFSPSNMAGNGFRYEENKDSFYNYNSYKGQQTLNAGYIMLDNIFNRIYRITGGVRVEKFYQQIQTGLNGSVKPTINTVNVLPSVALTIIASNKTNIRFSYAQTVTRPDFREISPFKYFDFVNFVSLQGNSKLTSGTIKNYDIRYETFPGDGQSFSLGAFYKQFTNPIEQMASPVLSNGNRSIQFKNAKSATLYGIETEFRLKLKKVSYALRNWEVSGNFAYMNSQVVIQASDSTAKNTTRPLQGQSPYIANAGIFYYGRSSGLSFAMNYNVVGPRIYSVGTTNYPDFYEKPRNILDVQIAKALNNRSELKLNVGDIFAQNYVLYQNTDSNKGYSSADHTVTRMKTAPLFLFSYIYRIK